MIKDILLNTGRNGRAYLALVLADRTGEVDARVWDNVEELNQQFHAGEPVRVRGNVQLFQGRRQLVVHRLERPADAEIRHEDLQPVSLLDQSKLEAELRGFVASVMDSHIRSLLERALAREAVWRKFVSMPAAKSIHHAYKAGLLEHVVSICGLMDSIARHYRFLNRDLLIFGAIFHDLGKIWELDTDGSTSYTDEGRLLGHLVMATEFIDELAREDAEFPGELKMVLKHIVLSHHGRLEYGSPKLPQFLEAYIVAAVDDLDSKINTIHRFMENERQNGLGWTRLNPLFERYFYLGVSADQAYGATASKGSPALTEEAPPSSGLLIPPGVDGLTYRS